MVQGMDAKIDMAVRAQERDVLPKRKDTGQEKEEEDEDGTDGAEADARGLGVSDEEEESKAEDNVSESSVADRIAEVENRIEDQTASADLSTADVEIPEPPEPHSEKRMKQSRSIGSVGSRRCGCMKECNESTCNDLLSVGPGKTSITTGQKRIK